MISVRDVELTKNRLLHTESTRESLTVIWEYFYFLKSWNTKNGILKLQLLTFRNFEHELNIRNATTLHNLITLVDPQIHIRPRSPVKHSRVFDYFFFFFHK